MREVKRESAGFFGPGCLRGGAALSDEGRNGEAGAADDIGAQHLALV